MDDRPRRPMADWSRTTAPASPRARQAPDEPARGDTIGRFIVLDVLGSGGMAVVYSAHDPHLDRKVALKLLRTDAPAQADDVRTRLVREAQAMARIDHPNVIKVHEVGTHGDGVYIAMEYAEGGTLRGWLEQQTRSQRDVIGLFVQAGRGLAAAHAAGLIHRDFKPDNVLLTKTGTARVTDFGLVSQEDASETPPEPIAQPTELAPRSSALSLKLTRTGAMMGTPQYMAPEQFKHGVATARTDQFAFCVALYEAIYGERPFSGSTLEELSENVSAGKLAVPASANVPSWLRRVLLRGLAIDPSERYPSMDGLLAELAPVPRRRRWPYVVALVAIAGGGAIALRRGDLHSVSCTTTATERAATAWSPKAAHSVHERFVATGRSFAERASKTVGAALDAYSGHWIQLASDVCIAERGAARPSELLTKRHACVDSRLDTLHGVVATLSADASAELVDHADDIARALPDLADCSEGAPEVPAAGDAATVAKLETDLASAQLHQIAGDYARALGEGTVIATRADALGWPSLQVRAHILIGRVRIARLEPARKELLAAAELATARGLDRQAATALALAVESAGHEDSADAVATLAPIVRAAARRTQDRKLEVAAETSISRAQVHAGQWEEGEKGCRQAYSDAQQLHDETTLGKAEDCLVESLVPLGKYAEVEPLVQRRIADIIRETGEDAPALATYYEIKSDISVRQGKIAEARQAAERSLAIRRRDWAPARFEVAQGLAQLAAVDEAEDKPVEAERLQEQALAITDESKPEQLLTIVGLHVDLAMHAASAGKRGLPKAFAHFDRAAELIRRRHGKDSIELAVLLLNYGQVKAEENMEVGIGMLREARDILERHHDQRAGTALTTLVIVADRHRRFADELKYAEEALARINANSSPEEIALLKWSVARSLVRTHGDRDRARRLAHEARQLYSQLGPRYSTDVANVDAWLAKH